MEGRCSTCKWARSAAIEDEWAGADYRLARLGFPLRCEKAQMIGTQYPDKEDLAKLAARMCVTIDGSEYMGELYVRPDFGCVQWEAK